MADISTGTILGELAALGLNKERTLTIKAKSIAVLYSLWADDLEQSLADQPEVSSVAQTHALFVAIPVNCRNIQPFAKT